MPLPISNSDTFILVNEYIAYILKKHGYIFTPALDKTFSSKEVFHTLKELSDDFESRYREVFDGLCTQLNIINVSTAYPSFVAVAKELFKDGDIKWGRITALFVFSGQLCLECLNKGLPELVQPIAFWLSQFIENNLSQWLGDHGGWNGYVDFYKKCSNIKSENTWPSVTNFICGIAAGALGAITLKNWLNKSL